MAITRTQIAKQLLANGGRIGFRVGTEGTGMPEGTGPGGTIGGPSIGASLHGDDKPNFIKKKKIITSSSGNGDKKVSPIEKFNAFQKQKFTPLRKNTLRNLIDYIGGGRKFQYPTASIFRDLTGKGLKMDVSDYEGLENVSPLQLQAMFGKDIIGTADEEKIRDISRVLGQDVVSQSDFEQFYPDKTLTGDGSNDPCDGPNPPAYCFTGIRSAAIEPEIEPEEQEPFELARAFRAKGGRMGFRVGGGKGMNRTEEQKADTGMAKGKGPGGTIGGFEGEDQSPKIITPLGGGGGESGNENIVIEKPPVNIVEPKSNIEKFINFFRSNDDDDNNPENVILGTGLAEEAKQNIIENKEATAAGLSEAEAALRAQGVLSIGGRVGLMGGGMPYEGGIMDFESARQMYGLGKLVKKVTRGIKKIAKSPIGKAALLGGGLGLAGIGPLKGLATAKGLGLKILLLIQY